MTKKKKFSATLSPTRLALYLSNTLYHFRFPFHPRPECPSSQVFPLFCQTRCHLVCQRDHYLASLLCLTRRNPPLFHNLLHKVLETW